MIASPVSNDLPSMVLPWRFTTRLHKANGVTANRNVVQTIANQEVVIARFKYGPLTMDRVIGVSITNPNVKAFGPGGAAQLHNAGMIREVVTGFYFPWNFASEFFNAFLNVETTTDSIDLRVTSSSTGQLYVDLYNVEIGQSISGK